jgi:hypothetical protein
LVQNDKLKITFEVGKCPSFILKFMLRMNKFQTKFHCGGMVMEDLEGCMQLGVATPPYTHKRGIGVPYHVEMTTRTFISIRAVRLPTTS